MLQLCLEASRTLVIIMNHNIKYLGGSAETCVVSRGGLTRGNNSCTNAT